ncbi:MAG: hypothetical protein H0X39_00270 [Actinobacteria bacterium]|nr:hypothetical protein [Actinomycetota bacterium]
MTIKQSLPPLEECETLAEQIRRFQVDAASKQRRLESKLAKKQRAKKRRGQRKTRKERSQRR